MGFIGKSVNMRVKGSAKDQKSVLKKTFKLQKKRGLFLQRKNKRLSNKVEKKIKWMGNQIEIK